VDAAANVAASRTRSLLAGKHACDAPLLVAPLAGSGAAAALALPAARLAATRAGLLLLLAALAGLDVRENAILLCHIDPSERRHLVSRHGLHPIAPLLALLLLPVLLLWIAVAAVISHGHIIRGVIRHWHLLLLLLLLLVELQAAASLRILLLSLCVTHIIIASTSCCRRCCCRWSWWLCGCSSRKELLHVSLSARVLLTLEPRLGVLLPGLLWLLRRRQASGRLLLLLLPLRLRLKAVSTLLLLLVLLLLLCRACREESGHGCAAAGAVATQLHKIGGGQRQAHEREGRRNEASKQGGASARQALGGGAVLAAAAAR
jgi:hypothetical protein